MLIYRLETKDGRGIYTSGEAYQLIDTWGDECNRHPTVFEDKKLNQHFQYYNSSPFPEYHFGFGSFNQIYEWLFGILNLDFCDNVGITFTVYECDEQYVVNGDTQCVFLIHHATLISKNPAREIYNQMLVHINQSLVHKESKAA